jgi:hypothetical protein
MKKNRKFLAAAALVAVVAGGGSAFTASLGGTTDFSTVAAQGTVSVTGATLKDLTFTSTASGITGATVVFTGHYDPAASDTYVQVGNTTFTCQDEELLGVDPDAQTATTANDGTEAECTGGPVATASASGSTTIQFVSSDKGTSQDAS